MANTKKAAATKPASTKTGSARSSAVKTVARSHRADAMAQIMGSTIYKEDVNSILPNNYVEPQFPSESIVLDWVLGLNGGFHHRGRMLMFQGEEHTGKTTLALHTAAAFQRFYPGDPVVVMDYERALKVEYAWQCGLNPDPNLTRIYQPLSVNESIRQCLLLMEADACRCFVFDSISMMLPDVNKDELLKGKVDVNDVVVGEHARFMQNALRKLIPIAAQRECLLIFINQESTQIHTNKKDQMKAKWAGSVTNVGYSTKGGRAPKQFASYQIETSKHKAFEGAHDDEEAFLFEADTFAKDRMAKTHNILRNHVRILKNKATGGGYRECDIWLRPGGGIDDWISVRQVAKHFDLIKYVGKGYRVGTEDNVLATYSSKKDAIEDLVLHQNMDVLIPLRKMCIERLKADTSSFVFTPDALDRLKAGDITEEEYLGEGGQYGGDDSVLSDDGLDIDVEA